MQERLRSPLIAAVLALGIGGAALTGCGSGEQAPQAPPPPEYVPTAQEIATKQYNCSIRTLTSLGATTQFLDGQLRQQLLVGFELEPRSPVADYTEKHFDDFGPKIPNWHSAGFEGRIYRPGSAKDDTGWPVSSVDRWTEFTTGEPKRDDLSPTYELNPLEQQPPGTEIVLYATTQASDPDGTTVRGYTQCGVIARKANGPIGDWIISIGNGADVPPYATPK